MGKVAEAIRANFTNRNADQKTLAIPEWDMLIYVGPWTWGQALAVQEYIESGSIDAYRQILKVKAKNEKGQPAFDQDDIDEMGARGDPALIRSIGMEVLELFPLSFDAEKKS